MIRALPRPSRPLILRWDALSRVTAWALLAFFAIAMGLWGPGFDVLVYYEADLDNLYPGHIFTPTYTYSPAFAWWTEPLRLLPIEAWLVVISAGSIAALAWFVTPWLAVAVLLVQFPPIWSELQFGNLNLITAAVLILAFRWPALYALPLLTKATPGIGLVWFLVRGEWRSLLIALGTTLAVALPTLVLHPGLWFDWVASLRQNAAFDGMVGVPLVLRAAVATAVIAWGARTDRLWTVLVGVALVAQVNGGGWLTVLGVIPLVRYTTTKSAYGSVTRK